MFLSLSFQHLFRISLLLTHVSVKIWTSGSSRIIARLIGSRFSILSTKLDAPSKRYEKSSVKLDTNEIGGRSVFARMNALATDLTAVAAAVFDRYAEHGMLKWDAFAAVVRGCGIDHRETTG